MSLIHGGDVEGFVRDFGREPVDFSANCNPLGLPESAKRAVIESLDTADRYPDPLSRRLRETLGGHLDVAPESIFCAAGAAEVIFRIAAAKVRSMRFCSHPALPNTSLRCALSAAT